MSIKPVSSVKYYSPMPLYCADEQNKKQTKSRWTLIETSLMRLLGGVRSSFDIEEAILAYNNR